MVDVIERLINKQILTCEGDFAQDGLLYCGKCKTPKQFRVTIGGAQRIVPIVCQCRTDEIAAEDKKIRDQQRAERIKSLRRNGITDRKYLSMTFENSTDEMKFAQNYVTNWERMERENVGLMLLGSTGTGKTFAAASIANALIDRGISVYMENILSVCDQMTSLFDEERPAFIRDLQNYRLLILDDFGVERGSDFVQEQIYNIIETRYRSGKPLIITSNLALERIAKCDDLKYSRTYDRLKEMCHPVQMIGESKRREIANSRRDEIKAILEGKG